MTKDNDLYDRLTQKTIVDLEPEETFKGFTGRLKGPKYDTRSIFNAAAHRQQLVKLVEEGKDAANTDARTRT